MAIYLDYNATTPVDPRVLEAMLPYFRDAFGNASSIHSAGQSARVAPDEYRLTKVRETSYYRAALSSTADHKEPYWAAPGMLCVAAHLRSTNCGSVSRASVKYCTGNSR